MPSPFGVSAIAIESVQTEPKRRFPKQLDGPSPLLLTVRLTALARHREEG
jgi:hypothetical protein